jgi:hypothetical protein
MAFNRLALMSTCETCFCAKRTYDSAPCKDIFRTQYTRQLSDIGSYHYAMCPTDVNMCSFKLVKLIEHSSLSARIR